MNLEKHCEHFQNSYPAKSISFIFDKNDLDKIYVDGIEWIIVYKCKVCGQLWKEFYTPTGHGEIPNLQKIDKWPE